MSGGRHQTTLSIEEAISIARRHSADLGRSSVDYEITSAVKHDNVFTIMFLGSSGRPGDHFSIHVDRSADVSCRLVEGR